MYTGRDFSDSTPTERKHFTFDYAGGTPADLAPGEYLTSAVWTLSIASDPNNLDTPIDPTHVENGSSSLYPSVNPTQAVSPFIRTLVGGVVYKLQCDAITTSGQTLSLHSHTRCVTPT